MYTKASLKAIPLDTDWVILGVKVRKVRGCAVAADCRCRTVPVDVGGAEKKQPRGNRSRLDRQVEDEELYVPNWPYARMTLTTVLCWDDLVWGSVYAMRRVAEAQRFQPYRRFDRVTVDILPRPEFEMYQCAKISWRNGNSDNRYVSLITIVHVA